MKNFKILDNVVSVSDEGELIPYKKYVIKDIISLYEHNQSDIVCYCYLILDNLLWTYDENNFINIQEYRKLKLSKIENI